MYACSFFKLVFFKELMSGCRVICPHRNVFMLFLMSDLRVSLVDSAFMAS